MNKTAIKNFAIWARVQLIEAAKQRAYEYEITDSGENKSGQDMVGGRLLTKTEKEQRNQLISEINRKGFSQVMEEAAYTWFNRFIALRFMEVNGYLPSKVRVFTDETGAFKPEILKQAMSVDLEGLDRSIVLDLLDKQNNEELYKYLLIAQCNALNAGLPYMFEKIGGWTELLFPANLLRADSVIGQMISEIPEEDWTDAVQIIGWMYQYYNSELKDETFALLKKSIKITKERIPAATQLFTPDWIVRYMVENSLGRLWYEGHPDFDKSQWKYYLKEAEQDPEVDAQLQKVRAEYATIKPEEIKVIDPCMGSGHILVYAFDVLMQFYISAGWSERDAAKSILENNLYGLDIDDRAGQLAYFAVMMKARKHNRRILNGDVKPNVLSIKDSNWMTDEFIAYVAGKDTNMKADLVMLRKTFRDAKEYGSILNVPTMQYDALYERIDIISGSYAENLFQAQYNTASVEQLLPLVKQAQIMSQKYDVVVTNPPYMGNKGFTNNLLDYIIKNYPECKIDLYAVFIMSCAKMTKNAGIYSLVTPESWMFLSRFEKLRKPFLLENTFLSMLHLGFGAFDSGFGTVAFTAIRGDYKSLKASCYRLVDLTSSEEKEAAITNTKPHNTSKTVYEMVEGNPICYWVSEAMLNNFRYPKVKDYGRTCVGLLTGNNERFLRVWSEISFAKMGIGLTHDEARKSDKKWFPINQYGEYRKWYGNNIIVFDWENDGYNIKKFKMDRYLAGEAEKKNSMCWNEDSYFCSGVTWNRISTDNFSARMSPVGNTAGSSSPIYFPNKRSYYLLALFNSIVFHDIVAFLNPTVSFQAADIDKVPVIFGSERVDELAKENEMLAKQDWDSSEISFDFKRNPLV